MTDTTFAGDPRSLQELLSGALTAEEARDLAERIENDPAVRSAVEEHLRRDTLIGTLDATVTGEMSHLPTGLAEVMGKLRRSQLAATVAMASDAGFDRSLVSPSFPFLAAPQAPDELGRVQGYRILRVLGSGGMGMVFDAEDIRLKRHVALKVMKPEVAAKAENSRRFLREAQAAATVEHDHIVPIFQVGEDNGVPFIAMPFLKGETLADRLRRGQRPPLAEVLRIGREITQGLAAAHKAGLVHRDIKPANIWLEEERDRVKILDFGLARLGGDDKPLTQDGVIIGTPSYMAPEQARGKAIDPRADLFSLGCVLYEMTTGQLPFAGPDTLAILSSLAIDTPAEPHTLDPAIPRNLSRLIMKLLEKNPADRPASAQAVADEMASLDARPNAGPGVEPRRTRWSRRPILLTATVLLLLVGAGWYLAPAIVRLVTNRGELADPTSQRPSAGLVLKDPGTLMAFHGNVQGTLTFLVTGTDDRLLWGTNVYTLDSRLATAAVHVGLLKVGETGPVEIEFVPAPPSFTGSVRNGITSLPYGTFPGAFRFPGATPAPVVEIPFIPAAPVPVVPSPLPAEVGKKVVLQVTGATTGIVWGTDVYSQDSDLGTAAVHVGLLKQGETGKVEIEVVASPRSFTGSVRNGVQTHPFGAWPGGAFRFSKARPGPAADLRTQPLPVGSNPLVEIVPEVGKKHTFSARGNVTGVVWGTDVYTQDSDLGAAAVHAGKLKSGETGMVEIEFVAVPTQFPGTTRNGVVSQTFGASYSGAFRIVKATPGPINEAELVPTPVPTLMAYASMPGRKVSVQVKGVVRGSVFGTDVYSLDSDVGAAALHAGVLKPGQTKTLEIDILASPTSFNGSTRNGIISHSFIVFTPGAFRFVKPDGK